MKDQKPVPPYPEIPKAKEKEFDYLRAGRDFVLPAWNTIPQSRKNQLFTLMSITEGQNKVTLNVPYTPDLVRKMEKWSDNALAFAAQVSYCYGHYDTSRWDPNPRSRPPKGCSTGKAANVIDQLLSKRLGLDPSRTRDSKTGDFYIVEGVLRTCYSTIDMWTWWESGPATRSNLAAARKHFADVGGYNARERAAKEFINRPLFPAFWKEAITLGEKFSLPKNQVLLSCKCCGESSTLFSDYLLHHDRHCGYYLGDPYRSEEVFDFFSQYHPREADALGPDFIFAYEKARSAYADYVRKNLDSGLPPEKGDGFKEFTETMQTWFKKNITQYVTNQ